MQVYDFSTRYLNDRGTVRIGRYHDGSLALQLVSEYGEPLSTATVCLSAYGETPGAGNVFVKDYGENEGMLENLQRLGIVGSPIRKVPCGFSVAYECELLAPGEDGAL